MSDELDQGATPEVIPENTQQSEPAKSMDDTLRDTLRDIASRNTDESQNTPAATPAGAAEDPEVAVARIRDTAGKFAAKPVPDGETVQPTAAIEPAAEQPRPAPNTWKKEAAAEWDKIPPGARAEIERREQDFHKGVEQYKAGAAFGQSIERAIAPYTQTLQQLGVSPDRAIGELMAADHKLRHGSSQEKTAYFAQLAQNYGVDIGQAAHLVQNTDPNVFAAQNEAHQLRAQLQNYQQTAAQQAEASLNSEIETFKANPSHTHFESVKGHMAALLQAGQAKDLADAYEQAIYANPTTRAAVLQQQATAQREEATKKAKAAQAAASVNVTRRPAMPTAAAIGSMDDTIRETYRRLSGAN